MSGVFVGRDAELSALVALCDGTSARGSPSVAIVVGDPGTGKTRLLRELAHRTPLDGQVWISGYEIEQHIPLAAARPLLHRLRDVPGAGELVDSLAFGAPGEAADMEPVRLFEGAHRALTSLGATLVLVDDLQWVDDMSVALAHYLVRAAEAEDQRLVLVAASRPAGVLGPLRGSLDKALGSEQFMEIELGPLTAGAGVQLVGSLSPDLDHEGARSLWQQAQGSPFWVELLARSEARDVDVDRVVADRLRSAGEDTVAVLALLSLAARPVSLDAVASINAWTTERTDRAATIVESVGLATRQPEGFTVAHDLIRAAAVRTIPARRSQQIRRALSRWLETTAGDDDKLLLEALEHRSVGGERAVGLALRLARSPRRTFLGVDGLRRLVAIADHAGPDDHEAAELRVALARTASDLGQNETAFRLWSEWSAVAADQSTAAWAALWASEAALELAWNEDAWRYLERARSAADIDAVVHVEVLAQESAVRRHLEGDHDGAAFAAGRALEAGRALVDGAGGPRRLDDPARRAWLRALLAASHAALWGDDPEALLHSADELSVTAAGFDDRLEVEALVDGAMALRFLGQNTAAEVRARQAWNKARRHVLPQAMLEAGSTLGRLLMSIGRLDEASKVVSQCSALHTRLTEFRPARAFAVVVEALVELSTGDWQKAIDGLRSAAAAEPDPHYRLHAHLERAGALARLDLRGAGGEIADAVRTVLDDAAQVGCRRCVAEATLRSGELLARVGAVTDAVAVLSAAPATVEADVLMALYRLRAEAAFAAAKGQTGAVDLGERVVAECERQGLRLEALWARLDLGAMLLDRDRSRAAAILRQAGGDAEEMGAVNEQQNAARMLRTLGVRTWRRAAATRGQDALAPLTDRERTIAVLVASGASNPEIASSVFLSRKTVERHVSNILAKLGARNRAELAALVADASDTPSP